MDIIFDIRKKRGEVSDKLYLEHLWFVMHHSN
jgi:hypothetical protein